MKRLKINGKIVIVFLVVAICAIALLSIDFNATRVIEAGELKENFDYGEFTFLRDMKLASGKTAYYYESGDEYYSYAHDNEGYVLVKDEDKGTLEYAVNDGGKPVSSGVSYGSEPSELSKIVRMLGNDIDLSHPEVQEGAQGLEGMTVIETEPVLAGGTNYVSITNLTIFISFYGENFTPSSSLINTFNGQSNSLKNYYQSVSNNKVNITSQIAYNEYGSVYVYQDNERRDYYNTSGSNRYTREASLVSKAINSAKQYYTFASGTNLDVNGDDYIDSVSIIVHGKSSSVWGSLLWPHSVNLDSIDGDNTYTVVNGKKVGKYSFNFSDDITLGVLCHETAHVLGAPDLYHYGTTTQNQDVVTVGKWDLMEMDQDPPQYLLAYMRKNYVGGIADSQIGTVVENGTYSLKPVTSATSSDVIAYKIPTSKEEYFMVEYRRKTESSYDSTLPGSGLIIYRVKEPADFSNSRGNMDAVYRGTGSKADEVYVFRPSIKMTGKEYYSADRYNHSRYDIDYAYLSPNNSYFNKLGNETSKTAYDFETIHFSDGTNSEIIIEALSISEDSIEFSVKLGQDIVSDNYFDDRISLEEAEYVDSTAYAGVGVNVKFGSLNPQYLAQLEIELQDANGETVVVNKMNLGRFLAEYNDGTREVVSQFIYASKGNDPTPGIFTFGTFLNENAPKKAILKVVDADGDDRIIGEIEVKDSANIGWDTILKAKTELKASIFASTRMTLGVRRDGSVDASGTLTTGQWAVDGIKDVISAALGYTHTLLVNQNLNVIAVGDDEHGETQVSSWFNVTSVAAGTYSSYGLKNNGTVVATGLNDKGQLNVSSWSGITQISAMGKRVAGLTSIGTVMFAGNFSDSEKVMINSLTNVKQIGVGLNYLVALKNDGTVQVAGTLPSSDLSSFKDVERISAGAHHIIALTNSGEVLATGDNSYGQCMVDGLYDVVDVAGGEYHSAFLREDGVVVYRGTGSTQYGTNEGIGNLLYTNYVALSEITGATGVSNGKIRIAKGNSTPIVALYSPTNATYVRLLFTSSDTSVATVSAIERDAGTITALEVGTSTLTIKDYGTGVTYTATIEVYEDKPLTGIAFTEPSRSIKQGQKAYLSVVFLPEDGTYGSLTPSFTTSDSSVITVNGVGLIEAVGEIGSKAIITAEAGGFTAQIEVTIVGEVSKIEIDLKGNSTKYHYDEDLDLSRYALKVTIGDSEETIAITGDMVTGYNKKDKESRTQTLTITYMGVTTTFEVSVLDYVTKVEKVSEPTKRYLYNHDLDVESGSFMVYKASGEVEGPHKFTASNFSGYRKDVIGVQKLTYTYTDSNWGTKFTFEEEVTVMDYVNSIAFVPLRSTYLYGEEIDRHEFVDVYMVSGATRQIQLIECKVKDEHTEVTDEKDPLYALYSLRVGAHQIKVTFVDPETKEEKSTLTTINVDIIGEFQTTGRDEEASCYYYEVGQDPYIGIKLIQDGVTEIEVKKYESANDNVYYKLFTMAEEEIPFDNTLTDDQVAMVRIFVKRQVLSGGQASVQDVEVWNWFINAVPLASTTKVEIHASSRTEYTYGEVINGDKDNLDIKLEKTLTGGEKVIIEPMELLYNSELIGEQVLKARYLGQWFELSITINDFVTELLPVENVKIIWNEDIQFEVYAVYAREGRKLLSSSEYVVSDYNNTTIGRQEVIVTYLKDPTITTSFTIDVEDMFAGIAVKDEPRKEYEVGEAFDPTSTYVITMLSGAQTIISFSEDYFTVAPSFNSEESAIGIAQTINIYYKGPEVSTPRQVWSGDCLVPDFVKKLVVATGSKNEYNYGESLSISVRAYYAQNSTSKILGTKDYSTDYNPKKVGEQAVTISYLYNGKTYTTTYNVQVIDTVSQINIASLPNRVSYGYGDVVNWTGAKVNVTYASAGVIAHEGDDIKKNLNVSYTTTVSGQQRVTISSGDYSAFFNISVAKESQAIEEKNTENVTVTLSKRQISLLESASIEEVVNAVKASDYLSASYVSVQYGTIDLVNDLKKSVGTGDKLVFTNREGKEVFVFTIYLKGDLNGDGKISVDDLPGMAGILANGTAKGEVMDLNGDGKANLTDLVGYARKTSGASPKQVPISDVAKTVIATPSRLKSKENQYE